MHSTLNPEQAGTRDVFPRLNEEIARVYEQIALVDKEISNLRHDAARHPSDPQTRMAAVNNVQVAGDRPLFDRPAVRGFTVLLLAACIGAAAIAWQSSYGNTAKAIIARWVPQLVVTSSPPLENAALPEQPSPPTVQASAAKAAPAQPPTQTAPEGVAPTAALSLESAQLLQSMARDLATEGQEIGQLKASIEQLNASVEQLKAGQLQMSRDIAKASEQNLRPKISAPAPQPAAAARKPMPPFPPPQATAQPMPVR